MSKNSKYVKKMWRRSTKPLSMKIWAKEESKIQSVRDWIENKKKLKKTQ